MFVDINTRPFLNIVTMHTQITLKNNFMYTLLHCPVSRLKKCAVL